MSEKMLLNELPVEFVDEQIAQLEGQFPEAERTDEEVDLHFAESIKLIDNTVSPEESERLKELRMSKTSGRGNPPLLRS